MLTVAEIAKLVGGTVVGDSSLAIQGVGSLESARPGEITFAEDKHLKAARASQASCLIVSDETQVPGKTLICVKHPRLAFAHLMRQFHPPRRPRPGVHPTAVVGQGVTLGHEVFLGPHVVIGDRVTLGDRAIVYAGVSIGEDSAVGADTVIYPNVTIYHEVQIGARVIIHGGAVIGGDGFGFVYDGQQHHKVPQVGQVIIEDDVEIGSNVTIDRATLGATVIGRGTKIDNLVQIAHNDVIGQHCILTAQVGISGSTQVGDRVYFAGQVGVADHVTIGEGAILGAQAGVPPGEVIKPGEQVLGAPARPIAEAKRQFAAIALLPNLFKEVRELKKEIERLKHWLVQRRVLRTDEAYEEPTRQPEPK